jgi:hypothetical protein
MYLYVHTYMLWLGRYSVTFDPAQRQEPACWAPKAAHARLSNEIYLSGDSGLPCYMYEASSPRSDASPHPDSLVDTGTRFVHQYLVKERHARSLEACSPVLNRPSIPIHFYTADYSFCSAVAAAVARSRPPWAHTLSGTARPDNSGSALDSANRRPPKPLEKWLLVFNLHLPRTGNAGLSTILPAPIIT